MKTNLLYLTLISVVLFFSGCSLKGTYQPDYITKQINPHLLKVQDTEVNIMVQKKSLSKHPTSMRAKMSSIDMDLGDINRNVSYQFFKQYFNKVNFKKSNKGIYIESNVLDYNYAYNAFTDGANLNFTLKVTVYIDGIKRFTKIYKSENSNQILFKLAIFSGINNEVVELFHKQLLHVYETQVKKDIIAVI